VRSEFRAMCEAARASILVPKIPLGAIRNAVQQPTAPRAHKRIVAIVLAGVLIVGAAAAAELWRGAHVSFGPSGQMRLSTVDEFRVKKNPTADDLRDVGRHARFPVEFPSGLPIGTTIGEIGYGPSIILVDYNLPGSWRRSNHLLRIVLLDPRALTAPTSPHAFVFRIGGLAATGSIRWKVGHELVIVMRSLATAGEIKNIKGAMIARAAKQPL
jgi:hypothetical protein